jgi:hypothetical protein
MLILQSSIGDGTITTGPFFRDIKLHLYAMYNDAQTKTPSEEQSRVSFPSSPYLKQPGIVSHLPLSSCTYQSPH